MLRVIKRHKTPLFLIMLLILLGLGSVSAGGNSSKCRNFPPPMFKDASNSKFEGHYRNCNYAYSVTVPHGLTGYSSPPPNPQHGFGILLSKKPSVYLWVDGSANSLGWQSLDEAMQARIDGIKGLSTKIIETKKANTTLGGLPAVRFTVKYQCSNTVLTEDYFIAMDAKKQIVYEIPLAAPETKYGEFKMILEKIADSWRQESPC
jgi:hypothetical protein